MRIENFVMRVPVRHHEACRVTELSIHTEQPLWILFRATVAFRLTYALFYQNYAKIPTFWQQIFGPARTYDVEVKMFGEKRHKN